MRLHVLLEAYGALVGDEVPRLRQQAAEGFQRLQDSGKLVAGGILVGKRGGFLLLDVESVAEAMDLLGSLADYFRMEVHLVFPLNELPQFFERHPAF